MPQSDPSKTEEATPKQRNRARDEGNVPRSEEVPKAVGLLAGVIIIRLLFPYLSEKITDTCHFFLHKQLLTEITPASTYWLFVYSVQQMAFIVLPIMIFILIACVLCLRLQVGHLWTFKPFK